MHKLRNLCVKAKETLSEAYSATIECKKLADGKDYKTSIHRDKFEELCMEIFQKCLHSVEIVIKDAKISKNKVDEIVLVGGSTRIPKIQKMLSEFFGGKALNKGVNPDEVVVHGAAV